MVSLYVVNLLHQTGALSLRTLIHITEAMVGNDGMWEEASC